MYQSVMNASLCGNGLLTYNPNPMDSLLVSQTSLILFGGAELVAGRCLALHSELSDHWVDAIRRFRGRIFYSW